MKTDINLDKQISSDLRHNRNCHAYLKELSPFIDANILKILPELRLIVRLNGRYNKQVAYGDLYSFAMTYLEDQIDLIYPKLDAKQTKALDKLIYAIYHNNNHILEHAPWLNELNKKTRPAQLQKAGSIAAHLHDHSQINFKTPKKAESLVGRFTTLFTPNFKPQLDTNIPSIKNHSYTKDLKAIEYRFSTQAQRHKGQVRISPLFKRWLTINAKQSAPTQEIVHIYYNNLGLDRGKFDIPGSNEKELTQALHQLEEDPSLKVAVITLPASKSLMHADHYSLTTDRLSYDQVFKELMNIAQGNQHSSGVTDFKISPKIRKLLFTGVKESEVLNRLLTQSFNTMGIKPGSALSTAEKQAVWLHFLKFELTDYIQTKLNPVSYNFSCKDAIDRGALSSLYYHLLKSFSLNQPMSKDDFEQNIDIPAANVKGRGMNFHRNILWNAINTLVNANYEAFIKDDKKSWLIYWRDMNCPHSQVKELLNIRLQQYEQQLHALPTTQQNIKSKGLLLHSSVKHQHQHQVSGQRLLLEVISRSEQFLAEKPSLDTIKAYKELANELQIKHPVFYVISGIMQLFLGAILLSKPVINQGVAKIKAAFFAPQREELCENILKNATIYQTSKQQTPPPEEDDSTLLNPSI